MTTIQKARADWASLRNALLATEKAIERIIRNKSWEPLGYGSFGEAWAAEMRDITLASEIRPHVAFYMFQEGYGPSWVNDNLKGVSGRRAKEWHGDWVDGVPPEGFHRGSFNRQALKDALGATNEETVVTTHVRKKPGKAAYVRFEVGATWYQEYKRIAKQLGTTVEEVARVATQEAFRSLMKERRAS